MSNEQEGIGVWEFDAFVDDSSISPAPDLTVTVRPAGEPEGDPVELYEDIAGETTADNPFTAQGGRVKFYASNGERYLIHVTDGDGLERAWDWQSVTAAKTDAAPVQSVHGRTGEVVAETGDYTAAQVGADPEGSADAAKTAAKAYTDDHEAKTDGIHGIPGGERAVHTEDLTRRGGAEFPLILVQDPLRQAVEAETGGRMTVLYDAAGNPNYMHVVPRFRYEDLGFDAELGEGDVTAFDTGTGSIKPEIFIGAYQASSDGGNAVSQPFKTPWTGIDWDDSKAACDAMGAGWHMMTVHEWAAVALWCVANGFEPRGNTNHGRAHDATWEVGRRRDGDTYPPGDSAGIGNIYAGSGPATWRHNGDLSGIADLVGNAWEWLWGAKIQDGRIHAVADNDTSVAESDWQDTGVDITGAISWTSSSVEGTELTDRILFTYAGIDLKGRLYVNDEGERFARRGGARGTGSNAGLGALSLGSARSETASGIGFRPSYIPQ